MDNNNEIKALQLKALRKSIIKWEKLSNNPELYPTSIYDCDMCRINRCSWCCLAGEKPPRDPLASAESRTESCCNGLFAKYIMKVDASDMTNAMPEAKKVLNYIKNIYEKLNNK